MSKTELGRKHCETRQFGDAEGGKWIRIPLVFFSSSSVVFSFGMAWRGYYKIGRAKTAVRQFVEEQATVFARRSAGGSNDEAAGETRRLSSRDERGANDGALVACIRLDR